jgi:uncharacterized protein (TIGR02996 family)
MTDCDALLAGIVSDPREETRWGVLADWLEEFDDPRRAEFLRLHRRMLATCCDPDPHPERGTWHARMVELLVDGVRPCVPQESLVLAGGVPMTFSFIPPGSFLMSLNVNFPSSDLCKVTVTKGFYLGVFSVTQAQWKSVMGCNPSHFKGDDRPVEMVSWDDCQDFCQRATEHVSERVKVRLPTATEWEWACRAGTTTWHYVGARELKFSSSPIDLTPDTEIELKRAAWFKANAEGATHPVGQLLPNAWGLYDMTGNVWQWCQDWWGHYSPEQLVDPIAPAGDVSRVYRGGGWPGPGGFCWTNGRSGNVPATRKTFVGLRVCFSQG